MADNETDILEEFASFLKARDDAAKEAAASSDDEIEIWDEKGRGARVKRSVAKPFLQSLGIDLDPPTAGDGNSPEDDDKKKTTKTRQSKGPTSTGAESTIRKYFTKAPVK